MSLPKKNILGVGITDANQEEILEYILKLPENRQKKFFIVTPNPEFLVFADSHSDFKKILNNADLALADGIGLVAASKFLGKGLKARVTGVDLMEKLCERVSGKPITVGFLGGRGGVAEKTAECLVTKYPGLRVAFAGEEWPGDFHSQVADDRASNIESRSSKMDGRGLIAQPSTLKSQPSMIYFPSSSIDILFVAFGFPKQEEWIAENLEKLPVRSAMGVGGAFDYISGKVPRAPSILRSIGLEWLFRLLAQPWRIKRQLQLAKFVWLVLKERFR